MRIVRKEVQSRSDQAIPLTVAGTERAFKQGRRPAILYAYGAYGNISSIAFNPYALPYLKRDILYIIAHVRGGGELGEEWHHDGRRLLKDNSIQDYLDCAASLVGEGLVAAGQIIALGESAGAIVTATAVLRRPGCNRGPTG